MNNAEKKNTCNDIFEDLKLSERERYKLYAQNDKHALELKEKVRKAVSQKGLWPVMNDTKWLKLQSSIQYLPFPPPYIEKLVLEDISFEEVQIPDIPEWLGDWNPFYKEGMSLFFAIEYIKVRPRYAEHKSQFSTPKMVDETQEFEQLLNDLQIPYDEDKGTYIIYGYK